MSLVLPMALSIVTLYIPPYSESNIIRFSKPASMSLLNIAFKKMFYALEAQWRLAGGAAPGTGSVKVSASRQGRWTGISSGALSGREALAIWVRGLRPRLISGVPSGR
jgi:hypothetical protein